MVKRKGGGKKQVLHLSEFLGNVTPAANTQAPSWSEECSTDLSLPAPDYNHQSSTVDLSSLPSAPRAQREGSFDPSKIPRQPPYTAYVGNLPFDSEDDDVEKMFAKNTVKEVRLLMDKENGRFKGFGYVEFHTPEGLLEALGLNEKMIRGRAIKIDVATQGGQNNRDGNDKWERGRSNEPYEDTTSDDWRRDTVSQDDRESPPPYSRREFRSDRDDSERKRYDEPDTFSRSDFGTKINDAPKEPYSSSRFRDEHDDRGDRRDRGDQGDRGDRGAWGRPRPVDREENVWVRRGEDAALREDAADSPGPTARPRLNLKPRTAPLTEDQKILQDNARQHASSVVVDTKENERDDPDGRENRPKVSPFGAAKPADTASWKSNRIQGTGPIKTLSQQLTDSNKFTVLNRKEEIVTDDHE